MKIKKIKNPLGFPAGFKSHKKKILMEQIKKITDVLVISYPRHTDEERHSFQKSNYTIPIAITKWWGMGLQDFVKYVHKADSGEGMFAYVKSCQYTDFAIEELKDNEIKELKLSISSLVQESYLKSQNILLENEELKSLIYSMLDEFNQLKELKHSVQELNDSNQELKHSVRELKMYKFKTDNQIEILETQIKHSHNIEYSVQELKSLIGDTLDKIDELKERVKILEDHQLNGID